MFQLEIESLESRVLLTGAPTLVSDFDLSGGFGTSMREIVSTEAATFHIDLKSIWRIDGDAPIKINAVSALSSLSLREQAIVDGQLYFAGFSDVDRTQSELWRTDGTEDGTSLVAAMHGSTINNLTVLNKTVFFADRDQLWAIDTASNDVSLVKDVDPARKACRIPCTIWAKDSDIRNLQIDDGRMYFTVLRGGEMEFWTSDGTTEGTQALSSHQGKISEISSFNEMMFFTVNQGDETELWSTDGSSERTQRVASLDGQIDGMVAARSQLFLADANVGIWRSDGTPDGTYQLAGDLDGSLTLLTLAAAADRLVLLARTPDTYGEVWVSDGTVEGTEVVEGIVPSRSCGTQTVVDQGGVYFIGSDENDAYALWKSDGTKLGTVRLAEGYLTPLGSGGGSVFFKGFDEATGAELWESDGTVAGTQMVADLNPGSPGSSRGRSNWSTTVDNFFYFLADDGVHGLELWKLPLDSSPLPGDADGDGHVTFADFTILSANYGRAKDVDLADGDFDKNGIVDFDDFLILSHNYAISKPA